MSRRGKYIVIEGADGTGKSTQVDLVQKYLKETHDINSIQIHEPDGFEGDENLGIPAVAGATELRKIIKNGNIARDAWTNVMLFTAARRLNWRQAIEPALNNGIWVVAARNYLSTVAYQGYGEGIDVNKIIEYTRENVTEKYMEPDLMIVLTLSSEAIRTSRIDQRGELEQLDTFESKHTDFQAAMQLGYLNFAKKHVIKTIDASQTIEAVQTEILATIGKL